MKEFNLNEIGHKMPYKVPREDFFENFSDKLFAEIETRQIEPIKVVKPLYQIRRDRLFRRLSVAVGIAGCVAVALVIAINSNHQNDLNLAINKEIVNSIDSYLTTLSDEELSELTIETTYQRDFYQNLPNYQ